MCVDTYVFSHNRQIYPHFMQILRFVCIPSMCKYVCVSICMCLVDALAGTSVCAYVCTHMCARVCMCVYAWSVYLCAVFVGVS